MVRPLGRSSVRSGIFIVTFCELAESDLADFARLDLRRVLLHRVVDLTRFADEDESEIVSRVVLFDNPPRVFKGKHIDAVEIFVDLTSIQTEEIKFGQERRQLVRRFDAWR